ncbi:type II toxin-antitoxin system death-on-curing family toxin [Chitinivibrio alkaliphilus]|uniref:Death-on-curing family protein n=1 Tax=Chitinivibrio alkaliphilus ACht1 TaxID=1313304 RepID=U7DCK2_9BACT|nr:type II toxin-antitoxin system death-on-curing family toxin [Chitinivibrio alkaliphilus]ERP39273.1 death-on-curing family protein [Chitinivibrio alkaliphilus ACht1]
MIRFLCREEILYLHRIEVERSGGTAALRDARELAAILDAPKVTFGGTYLMDIFSMAATYIQSIVYHHPFLDGNKRTALLSALTFLFFNGYTCDETYEEQLADVVLDLISHDISKDDLAHFFSARCFKHSPEDLLSRQQ